MKTDLLTTLPDSIKKHTGSKPFTADSTGMSAGSVFIYDDTVLKVEPRSIVPDESIALMKWLDGKLPVPKIIEHCVSGDTSYTLMSRISGKMSCDNYYLEHSDELLELLAEAVRMLWSVDISDCPRVRDLDAELADAREHVRKGLVDMTMCQPETFGEGGFKDPSDLLSWLENNRPPFDPVLSHGDLCLPNIFVGSGKISGFIDLGDCGIADRYRDISLCWRSLKQNFDGTFGGKVYPGFDPDRLFEKLGIAPDREKLRYYLLLDELF